MLDDPQPPRRKPLLSPSPFGCAMLCALLGAHIGFVVAGMYFFAPGHGWGGPDVFPRLCLALCVLASFTAIPAIGGAFLGMVLSLFAWDGEEES